MRIAIRIILQCPYHDSIAICCDRIVPALMLGSIFQINAPESKPDTLGLTVLDEPCAKQSDPVVLDLQLRAISKQTTDKKLVSVESLQRTVKPV